MAKQQPTPSKIVGSASIPLEEWMRMRTADEEAAKLKHRCLTAMKQVQTLLSFLLKAGDEEVGKLLAKTIYEFNSQSDVAVFRVEDGVVYIELLEDEA